MRNNEKLQLGRCLDNGHTVVGLDFNLILQLISVRKFGGVRLQLTDCQNVKWFSGNWFPEAKNLLLVRHSNLSLAQEVSYITDSKLCLCFLTLCLRIWPIYVENSPRAMLQHDLHQSIEGIAAVDSV